MDRLAHAHNGTFPPMRLALPPERVFDQTLAGMAEMLTRYLASRDELDEVKLRYFARIVRDDTLAHPAVERACYLRDTTPPAELETARALMTQSLRTLFHAFLTVRGSHPSVGDDAFVRALLLTSELENQLLGLAAKAVECDLLDPGLEAEFRPYINPRPE